ncbi:site-specific integrase [Streptomyces albidoflavus]|uniref:site-specific integrase n=1 Tax=Streptomyces albidoflavus TaxID=1886 RepID=UPI003412CED4
MFQVKRPKGADGKKRTHWLWPEQAQRVFVAAAKLDLEFSIFLQVLCYTGVRLEEGLCLEIELIRLEENFAYVPDTKNGEPRAVFLPPNIVDAIKDHPRGLDREGYLFRYHKSGALYTKLRKVFKAAKVPMPPRVAFHIFRHTYGTWMTRYGGLDAKGLTDTGTWKDIKSAVRYRHSVTSEEAQKAALLPRAQIKSDEPGKSVETASVKEKDEEHEDVMPS